MGRRIFFDKVTGKTILDVQSQNGTLDTVERNIEQFVVLSERNRNTFDVLELEIGAYQQDFQQGTLIGVDVVNKVPLFSYRNPNEPYVPIAPEKAFSTQIIELQDNLYSMQDALDFLLMGGV